jgi:hypothetical protein
VKPRGYTVRVTIWTRIMTTMIGVTREMRKLLVGARGLRRG